MVAANFIEILGNLSTEMLRSIALLDKYFGENTWQNRINIQALDMRTGNQCIIGQLFREDFDDIEGYLKGKRIIMNAYSIDVNGASYSFRAATEESEWKAYLTAWANREAETPKALYNREGVKFEIIATTDKSYVIRRPDEENAVEILISKAIGSDWFTEPLPQGLRKMSNHSWSYKKNKDHVEIYSVNEGDELTFLNHGPAPDHCFSLPLEVVKFIVDRTEQNG